MEPETETLLSQIEGVEHAIELLNAESATLEQKLEAANEAQQFGLMRSLLKTSNEREKLRKQLDVLKKLQQNQSME